MLLIFCIVLYTGLTHLHSFEDLTGNEDNEVLLRLLQNSDISRRRSTWFCSFFAFWFIMATSIRSSPSALSLPFSPNQRYISVLREGHFTPQPTSFNSSLPQTHVHFLRLGRQPSSRMPAHGLRLLRVVPQMQSLPWALVHPLQHLPRLLDNNSSPPR